MEPKIEILLDPQRKTLSTAAEQALAREAVLKLLPSLPKGAEVEVVVFDPIPEGEPILLAHNFWLEGRFERTETPPGLPRKPIESPCPAGLIKIEVGCVKKRTPGMGSWHGFEGYFLSALIHINDGTVWDARGEVAK